MPFKHHLSYKGYSENKGCKFCTGFANHGALLTRIKGKHFCMRGRCCFTLYNVVKKDFIKEGLSGEL